MVVKRSNECPFACSQAKRVPQASLNTVDLDAVECSNRGGIKNAI
jgi:hypothetical protein